MRTREDIPDPAGIDAICLSMWETSCDMRLQMSHAAESRMRWGLDEPTHALGVRKRKSIQISNRSDGVQFGVWL
jgi:hypothetical protein